MKSILQGGKYHLYTGNFCNNNKTCIPTRTTTLGYEKMKLIPLYNEIRLYNETKLRLFHCLPYTTPPQVHHL